MSGRFSKEAAGELVIDRESRAALLQKLIVAGFFDSPVTSEQVVLEIREQFGKRWKTSWVQVYLRKFIGAAVIRAIKIPGHRENFYVLASVKRETAVREIKKGKKLVEAEHELFSPVLVKRLEQDFQRELDELHDNFGKNANCTAFLLRKILEKLVIIVFGKNGRIALLQDKKRPGGWVGLERMIEIAAQEKINGVPFLIPKTAREIQGVKFLGDTAAHNPLASVDTNTILPQMPYIITAYEELAARL